MTELEEFVLARSSYDWGRLLGFHPKSGSSTAVCEGDAEDILAVCGWEKMELCRWKRRRGSRNAGGLVESSRREHGMGVPDMKMSAGGNE
jgi:hypothetical protein